MIVQYRAKYSSTCYSLSTDVALVMSKRFLRSMAQPYDPDQTGVSLWSLEDIEARQAQVANGLPAADNTDMQVDEDGEPDYFAGLEDSAAVEAMLAVEANA